MHRIPLALALLLLAVAGTAAPVTLTGTVVTADGKAVAGAEVATAGPSGGAAWLTVKTLSAADGAFRLSVETEDAETLPGVVAYRPGVGMGFALGSGEPFTITLLTETEPRGGMLRDRAGNPVAGAEVGVLQLLALGAGASPAPPGDLGERPCFWSADTPLRRTRTDAAGRFSFADIPRDWGVVATVAAEGCARVAVTICSRAPVRWLVEPGACLTGRLIAGSQPLGGVLVQGYSPDRADATDLTTSAADGTFTLAHLAPGQVLLAVRPPGLTPSVRRMLTVQAGETLGPMELTFSAGATVRGSVVEQQTGRPLAKATVSAVPLPDGGGQPEYALSRADGSYELRVAPGSYSLTASPPPAWPSGLQPPGRAEAQTIAVREGEAATAEALAVPTVRRVTVRVLLPDGTAAAGAELTCAGPLHRAAADGTVAVTVPEPVASGARGAPPARAPLLLWARLPERNLAGALALRELREGSELLLQPAATADVHVRDTQGRPVAGVGITAVIRPDDSEAYAPSFGPVYSDAAGLVRLTCLPWGRRLQFGADWRLQHLVEGGGWPPRDERGEPPLYTFTADRVQALPDLVLGPGRSLKVFVGNADGQPLPGSFVLAERMRRPVTADERGQAQVTGLPLQGKVLVAACHPVEPLYACEQVDPAADYWPGLLLRPLGRATGTITDAAGAPLPGLAILCQPVADWAVGFDAGVLQTLGLTARATDTARTDAQGRWSCGELLSGAEYRIFAQREENEGFRALITFKATGGAEPQDVGPVVLPAPAAQ